jgi:hypothetical protein
MPRFLLLVNYDSTLPIPPMTEWDPADITAHLDYLRALNQQLAESGELVEMQALTGPELAKVVTSDGSGPPVITDGPFPEAKEVLAGYQLLDVESEARALEIAALVSSAPGAGGVPVAQAIEVRQVMSTFVAEL